VATIAEVLLEQGRQQAGERQRQGDIRGSMWQNLARIAQQYGQNVQQQQIEAPIRAQEAQMRRLQIQKTQGEIDDRKAAQAREAAFSQALVHGDDDALVKIDPERGAKVITGRDAVVKARQSGYLDRQKILMDSTLGLEGVPKDLLPDAYVQKRKELVDNKIIDPKDAPETFDPVWFTSTLAHAKKLGEKSQAEIDKTRAETGRIQAETSGTLPLTPAQQETARHNKETERIAALTAGKAEAAQKETERHNRATEAAANPFGGAPAGPSGAAGPTGDDFLKTLPASAQAQVKALAEGRQPFPTGMSYAKLQPLIAAVTQYDPTFDAANYTARSKARSDLTSPNGQGGKTINSLNTAIQHLGRLSDLIETEDNSNIPLVNAVMNPLRTAGGSTAVTNFNAVQPQAMKEIERLWRGAGGSEGDINALKDSLSKNAGKQQQREALQEFVNLVRGKLDSTEQQRDNILGPAGKGVPVLFEQNKPVLEKIIQRASGETSAASAAPKVGAIVQYQGKPYRVKSIVNGHAELEAAP
jgi:hypothetical protein